MLLKLLIITITQVWCQKFASLKFTHVTDELTDPQIRTLATLQDNNQLSKDLEHILIPRVVGTKNHEKVYQYIKNTLEHLQYEVETDEFNDVTPFGNRTFKNVIATLNPNAERFFAVAAHYDSKYFADIEFVGATDSAVPCAMMLQIARIFKKLNIKDKSVSLKLIFFDGEEAFVEWGPNDSIYGARHLANRMHRERSLSKTTKETVTDLQRIDCLMLLDLLGAANPSIYNYFQDTSDLFYKLSKTEKTLKKMGLLKKQLNRPYFHKEIRNAFIDDDHTPFLTKDVKILHIIPVPFPRVWHTEYDNENVLDANAIADLSFIIQAFLAQYLNA